MNKRFLWVKMANILWIESGVDNLMYTGRYRDFLRTSHEIDPIVAGCMDDLDSKLSRLYDLVLLNPYDFYLNPVYRVGQTEPVADELYSIGVKAYEIVRLSSRNSGTPITFFNNGLEREPNKALLVDLQRKDPLTKLISLPELSPRDLARLIQEVVAVRRLSSLLF